MNTAADEGELETQIEEHMADEELEAALTAADQDYSDQPGETIQFQGQNQREVDAMARLQKDMDAALARPAVEEEDEDLDEEFEEEE